MHTGDAPLDLARAWLRCFRSFAERGGFVLTDFKPAQFALDGLGRLTLVDGPAPNTGAVAAFARRHFLKGHPSKIHVPGSADPKPDHLDLEPGLPWPCGGHGAASAAHYCAKRTYAYHHCRENCEEGSRGAPEIGACAGDPAACAPFDWRVHVYDLAARSWLFPLIVDVARDRDAADRVDALSARMLAEDPDDRPTFDDLLRDLEDD